MVLKSNNNIIIIVLIIFIIFVLYLNYKSCKKNDDNDEECTTCTENFEKTPTITNKKPKVKFDKIDNVKYFDKKNSPSDISNIIEEKKRNTIEEFDYDNKVINDIEILKINKDSTKITSSNKISNDDKISDKFNKLIGNVDSDITNYNLKLISGKESNSDQIIFKSDYIYNNSLTDDTITNNNKYNPFTFNNYRSV